MDLIIISGISGSGKSIALQSLEDLGYYCIDNIPVALLPRFIETLKDDNDGTIESVAVSIDARNRKFLKGLSRDLDAVKDTEYRIVFLTADQDTLLRRFSETRRKHPLTDRSIPLLEGIATERILLKPLEDRAERIINTSLTTPHELRSMIREFAGGHQTNGPSILFQSFGYKFGTPRDADFIFDVRCLPNPYWEKSLRALSGLDQPVIDFLEREEDVALMVSDLLALLEKWLPRFEAESRSYITFAVGCTGGQHRSVYITQRLSELFASRDIPVQTRHRDLDAFDPEADHASGAAKK